MTTETTATELTDAQQAGGMQRLLEQEGVQVDSLHVAMVGDEQFIGELLNLTIREGGFHMRLKNPKRMLRLQRIDNGAFRVEFAVVDFDLLDGGEVEVFASGYYPIATQSLTSQAAMYNLYLNYLEGKKVQRAAQAGIVPARIMPPGGIGNVRPLK